MIIAVNYRGSVVAVNATDGVVMWLAELKAAGVNGVAASPAVGRDGSLYFPDYEAGLFKEQALDRCIDTIPKSDRFRGRG